MSSPSTAIQPDDFQILECIFDACIALSYYSMPCTLVYFLFSYKERIPMKYKFVVIIIGAFICLCGTTHVVMIFTKLFPSVSLNETVLIVFKGITAVISFVTSIILWYLIPLFVNFGFTSLDLHIEYLKLRNYLQQLKQYAITQIKEKEEVLKQLHYVYSIVLILHSLRPLSRNFSLIQSELQFMLTSPVSSAASSLSPADIASGSAFTSYFSISTFFSTIPSSLSSLILRTSYMMEKHIAASSLPTLYPVAFKDFNMDNNKNKEKNDSGSQSVPASPSPLVSATLLATEPTVATGTATPNVEHHRHLLRANRATSSFVLAAEPATHTTLVVSHESTTPQHVQQQHSEDTTTATATTATAANDGGVQDRHDTDDEEDGKKMFVSPSAIHLKYASSKSNTGSSSGSSGSDGGSAVAAATSPTSPPSTATSSSAPGTPIPLMRPSINIKPNNGSNMVELTSARLPVIATRMSTTSDSPLQTNVTTGISGGGGPSSGSFRDGSIQRLSLDECLNNIIAVEVLKDICSRQFCIENIMFLIDARKYRLHMGSVNERRHYSRHIYDTYVTQGSLYEVNISSQARHYIAQNNKYAAPDLFTPAEKEIMKLMEDNVFQRIFIGMKEFQLVCTMPTYFKDMSMGISNMTTPATGLAVGAKTNDGNLLSNTKVTNQTIEDAHEIASPLDDDEDDVHQPPSSYSDRFRQLLSHYSLKVNNYSMNKSSTKSSKSDKTVNTSNDVTKPVSPSINSNTSNITVITTTTTNNTKDNGGSDLSPLVRANMKLAQGGKRNSGNNTNKGDLHNVLVDDLV